MILSDFGKIVDDEWHRSFEIRRELVLDEFVLMPNHLHAIIILYNDGNINNDNGDFDDNGFLDDDGIVETHGRVSLRSKQPQQSNDSKQPQNPQHNFPTRKPKSISSFIAGYKSRTITLINDFIDAHKLGIPKYNRNNRLWQLNYHDHIIRNKNSYWRIKKYIMDNPANWDDDELN
jgi:REP element-mobilizing transposase RayT